MKNYKITLRTTILVALTVILCCNLLFSLYFMSSHKVVSVSSNDPQLIQQFFSEWRAAAPAERKNFVPSILKINYVLRLEQIDANETLLAGMTRAEVESIMGEPDSIDPIDGNDILYKIPGYTTRSVGDVISHLIVDPNDHLYITFDGDSKDAKILWVSTDH